MTSLGLYRNQTAEHVLETNRREVTDYGVPKEVLTDNGRQYTNWPGKTRYEQELEKDRVRHIRSPPDGPRQDRAVLEVDHGGVLAAGAV
jgi:transposase InsO family protein